MWLLGFAVIEETLLRQATNCYSFHGCRVPAQAAGNPALHNPVSAGLRLGGQPASPGQVSNDLHCAQKTLE
jgi:hypothetical protein